MILSSPLEWIGKALAGYLTKPISHYRPSASCDFACFSMALKPCDVILVEGHARISTAIKYLTQSTWSHAALYVGPIEGRSEPDGEAHVLVEAELGEGVITAPLSKYAEVHTRICRPIGLTEAEKADVIAFALDRVGNQYDLRNVIDLARYLLPTPPVPSRFRRRMLALGSGSPTRAICSSLIAQAFQSVRYPILPDATHQASDDPEAGGDKQMILHIRHHSLFAPRDFDISPYFVIVKPTVEMGFDFRKLVWAISSRGNPDSA